MATLNERWNDIQNAPNFNPPIPRESYESYIWRARREFGVMFAKLLIEDDGTVQRENVKASAVGGTLWKTFSSILPVDVWDWISWDLMSMMEVRREYYSNHDEPMTVNRFHRLLKRYNEQAAEDFKQALDELKQNEE